MNTMVVSIIERTGEIGTMRALGAQKGYIRRIFLTETFTLAVAGGIIGLVVGGIILLILHFVGVPSNNPILDLVFGGKVLYPVLSWMSAVWAMVIMVLVGVVSSFDPTAVALRITPVKAMSNN
jgi:putative ABC transport system permease protein